MAMALYVISVVVLATEKAARDGQFAAVPIEVSERKPYHAFAKCATVTAGGEMKGFANADVVPTKLADLHRAPDAVVMARPGTVTRQVHI